MGGKGGYTYTHARRKAWGRGGGGVMGVVVDIHTCKKERKREKKKEGKKESKKERKGLGWIRDATHTWTDT